MTEPENMPREKATEDAQVCPGCGEALSVSETREDGSLVLDSHDHSEAPAEQASTAERHTETGQTQAPAAVSAPREQGTVVSGDAK